MEQDNDIVMHENTLKEDIDRYHQGLGNGPDPEELRLDMKGEVNSGWNSKAFQILCDKLKMKMEDYNLLERSDAVQVKMIEGGQLETPEELATRVQVKKDTSLKSVRHNTRHHSKFEWRVQTVQATIVLKRADGEPDVQIWRWLEKLLFLLGVDGMSSEESATENDIETVYWVKILTWRRDIEKELRIIDHKRMLDSEIFSPQGAKPVTRVRGTGNPVSTRDMVRGLPWILYDDAWYDRTPSDYQEVTLAVSKEQFQWLSILSGCFWKYGRAWPISARLYRGREKRMDEEL
ncbi:hypothetical protein K439DRAFT_1624785 [Ramaria rubella]|nr:hypothetical protein K439DRAFT_1624785 [Ramaria rubella]